MYTLVIIDMQPKFKAANNRRCVANCVREVTRAIQDGARIIVLEYGRRGNENGHNTKYAIRKLVKSYSEGYFLTKECDDGAYVIANSFNFDNLHFRLCGVNLGACVSATAQGLRGYFEDATIEIVSDAVHQPYAWQKDYAGYANHNWIPKNILENLYEDYNIIPV